MGRKTFTQELKELAKAGVGMDAGDCWLVRVKGRPEPSSRRSSRPLTGTRSAEREAARSNHREPSDHEDSGRAPDERGSEAWPAATNASIQRGAIDHAFDSRISGEAALAGDDSPEGKPVRECPALSRRVCLGECGEG